LPNLHPLEDISEAIRLGLKNQATMSALAKCDLFRQRHALKSSASMAALASSFVIVALPNCCGNT
jgi:hypothetical protein